MKQLCISRNRSPAGLPVIESGHHSRVRTARPRHPQAGERVGNTIGLATMLTDAHTVPAVALVARIRAGPDAEPVFPVVLAPLSTTARSWNATANLFGATVNLASPVSQRRRTARLPICGVGGRRVRLGPLRVGRVEQGREQEQNYNEYEHRPDDDFEDRSPAATRREDRLRAAARAEHSYRL